jgi:hypothetical protein
MFTRLNNRKQLKHLEGADYGFFVAPIRSWCVGILNAPRSLVTRSLLLLPIYSSLGTVPENIPCLPSQDQNRRNNILMSNNFLTILQTLFLHLPGLLFSKTGFDQAKSAIPAALFPFGQIIIYFILHEPKHALLPFIRSRKP